MIPLINGSVAYIQRRVLKVQSVQRMFSLTLRSGLGVAFSVWILITLEIIVFGYPFDTRAVLTCCNSFNLPSSVVGRLRDLAIDQSAGSVDFVFQVVV